MGSLGARKAQSFAAKLSILHPDEVRARLYSVGYPPPHGTPTLDLDIWKYWRNRFDTFNVHFENGHVVRIQD